MERTGLEADYEKTDHYSRSRLCISGACAGGAALRQRKIDNSIPSKETVAAYILEKGEQYAAEQLRAQDRDSLRRSWGEPDATPSGIWADVWDLDADTTILVFYDAEMMTR